MAPGEKAAYTRPVLNLPENLVPKNWFDELSDRAERDMATWPTWMKQWYSDNPVGADESVYISGSTGHDAADERSTDDGEYVQGAV